MGVGSPCTPGCHLTETPFWVDDTDLGGSASGRWGWGAAHKGGGFP